MPERWERKTHAPAAPGGHSGTQTGAKRVGVKGPQGAVSERRRRGANRAGIPMSTIPDHQGYLYKLKENKKEWKKIYVTLQNCDIVYYESPSH
eukprot:605457-Prymnesium_polylepis.1